MHEMKVVLPPNVITLLKQEAESLGITYSKHLLATLDAMATYKSKELIRDKLTNQQTTT